MREQGRDRGHTLPQGVIVAVEALLIPREAAVVPAHRHPRESRMEIRAGAHALLPPTGAAVILQTEAKVEAVVEVGATVGKEAAMTSPVEMEIDLGGGRDTGVMRDQETTTAAMADAKGPSPLVGDMAEGEEAGELELQISCNSVSFLSFIIFRTSEEEDEGAISLTVGFFSLKNCIFNVLSRMQLHRRGSGGGRGDGATIFKSRDSVISLL